MVREVRAAQEAARKAIEATYSGVLTVTEMGKVKDERTKLTKDEPAVYPTHQEIVLERFRGFA